MARFDQFIASQGKLNDMIMTTYQQIASNRTVLKKK